MRIEAITNFQYGFEITLTNTNHEDAVCHVTDELEKEGFGILTEIEVSASFKKRLNVDFRHYMILGTCHPELAYRALGVESRIGLLLPCNVLVRESPSGNVIISIADPRAMFALVNNPAVAPVAAEADERLRRVIDALASRVAA
jgi:uncharacterized protein (DUF302 family)